MFKNYVTDFYIEKFNVILRKNLIVEFDKII